MSTAALAVQALLAALEIYRIHSGKPVGWKPSAEEWTDLENWAGRTPEDIKREARGRKPSRE